MIGRCLTSVCALLLALTVAGAAQAQSRIALVIGNGAYQSLPALKTPVTDATVVAETLRAAAYDVTELHDVAKGDIGQALRDFLDKLAAAEPGSVAFFYYSGHGARSKNENFLIPVDAAIGNEADIFEEAFRLKELTDELVKLPLAARIIVLDASRDHAIGGASGKPAPKGLATGQVLPGMLIAYAAAPGALAVEGDADYSLYTGGLVTQMRQPGLDMAQALKNTRVEVSKITDGLQTPWSRSALRAPLRLFAASGEPATEVEAAPPPPERKRRVHPGGDPGRILRDILRHAPF